MFGAHYYLFCSSVATIVHVSTSSLLSGVFVAVVGSFVTVVVIVVVVVVAFFSPISVGTVE